MKIASYTGYTPEQILKVKAHDKTCEEYDYPRATNEFYGRLQHEHNARLGKGDIISGGVSYKKRDDWHLCL